MNLMWSCCLCSSCLVFVFLMKFEDKKQSWQTNVFMVVVTDCDVTESSFDGHRPSQYFVDHASSAQESWRITVGLSVADLVTICQDAYSTAANSHALVICTEWDEFAVSDWWLCTHLPPPTPEKNSRNSGCFCWRQSTIYAFFFFFKSEKTKQIEICVFSRWIQ